MKNVRKILAVVLASVALGMLAGCGSGDDNYIPTTQTATTIVTVIPGTGTTVVAPATTVKSASGATVAAIITGTIITPSSALPATTSIDLKVVTPTTVGDIAGMNKPTGAIISAAKGAVDISIAGVDSFTVDNAHPIAVSIPVTSCTSTAVNGTPVTVVKKDGTNYSLNGTCTANVVAVSVINFCSLYANATIATQ